MDHASIAALGWRPFFQQQLTLDEWESAEPARVVEYHRSVLRARSAVGEFALPLTPGLPRLVVGDWILVDRGQGFIRLLDRKSVFVRRSAGVESATQLIAANVDTAFILCSLNEDFNLNRIERYLSVVNASGAVPVVVLSKADLAADPERSIARVRAADPALVVEAIDCRDPSSVRRLDPWIEPGETIAVLGSSGAGKSTLINTLSGSRRQATADIRASDDKGRHTTTSRSLIALDSGATIIDTPGMREIQLAECGDGVESTFAEIGALAARCRFADCEHGAEPGCAVRAAVESGDLDARRLENYRKLRREVARNAATLAEKRAQDRALGRFYKRSQAKAGELKGR